MEEKIKISVNNENYVKYMNSLDNVKISNHAPMSRYFYCDIKLKELTLSIILQDIKSVTGTFVEINFDKDTFFDCCSFNKCTFENCKFDNISIRWCKFNDCKFINCTGEIHNIRAITFKKDCIFENNDISLGFIDEYVYFNSVRYNNRAHALLEELISNQSENAEVQGMRDVQYPLKENNESLLFTYLVKTKTCSDYYLFDGFKEAVRQATRMFLKGSRHLLIYQTYYNEKTGEYHACNTYNIKKGILEMNKEAEMELPIKHYISVGKWLNPNNDWLDNKKRAFLNRVRECKADFEQAQFLAKCNEISRKDSIQYMISSKRSPMSNGNYLNSRPLDEFRIKLLSEYESLSEKVIWEIARETKLLDVSYVTYTIEHLKAI